MASDRNDTCVKKFNRKLRGMKRRLTGKISIRKSRTKGSRTNLRLQQRTMAQKTKAGVTVTEAAGPGNHEKAAVKSPKVSLDPQRSNISQCLKIWAVCWEPRTVEAHPYITDRAKDDAKLFSSIVFR